MIATILLVLFQSSGTDGGVSTQRQLDLAPPGAVIVSRSYMEDLVIRKPVTLIGFGDGRGHNHNSITLDGPGSGKVSIVGMSFQQPIKGGGFEELRLDAVFADSARLEGFAYIEAQRGTLRGPLFAPGADVVLSDFSVWASQDPSVTCDKLWDTRNAVGGFVDVAERYTMPNDLHAGSDAVRGGWIQPGEAARVYWSTPGPVAFIYMSINTQRPTTMRGANFGFNHLGSWSSGVQLVAVGYCPGQVDIPIPPEPGLMGRVLAFQAFDPPAYYSRPVSLMIRY
jgi:hypothetical protein